MDMENSISLIKVLTQVNLILVELKEKEDYFIPTETSILGIGKTTRLMGLENIFQELKQFLKGNGKTTRETGTVKNLGLTERFLKVNIEIIKKMGKGSFDGPTGTSMWEISKRIEKMVKER